MSRFRILVVGGYGFFGRRLVERLARHPSLHIQIAGRAVAKAEALIREVEPAPDAELEAVALDSRKQSLADELMRLGPQLVIDASGPFQGADYRVPLACIAARIDHIDLADGRAYVCGIDTLHEAALAAGVSVVSGASSVPALSSAAADHLSAGLVDVRSIDVGISPGNRTERGLSTVRAILSYSGKPLPSRSSTPVFGWSGSRRHRYPAPVGLRMLSPCDVPDLVLLPVRYAGTPEVRFGAGLELPFLHRGMNLMAWMARAGWVSDWSRHASWLSRASDLFRRWGSDAGAMHVTVEGRDERGEVVFRTWHLVATEGDGPYVPTLAAAALVRKLREGTIARGAFPCVGLLTLADFAREMDGLAIRTEVLA